jgi:biopolymer transport protein TolQ
MTLFATLAATAAEVPTRLDPLKLFLDADIVVQVVILGRVLARVWVWTFVVTFSLRMGNVRRRSASFEEEFWEVDQPDTLVSAKRRHDNPSARVAAAGLAELRTSTKAGVRDREATRQRATRGDFLLADASVRVGFISPEGRPRRQPAAWRSAFEAVLDPKETE